jgi:NAD(P)-dependent dehydrogenase (short-subunit alcohol dehydrogenase family)
MAGLLEGQVAVVTGTGPNIGGMIARTLAENGAKVVCIDFMGERAEAAAAGIREAGGEALAVSCDISKPEEVDAAFKKAVADYGGVHILVNNAAANTEAGILDVTLDEWHWVHSIILDGVMLCSQAAARQMVAQGVGGAIVNIASTTGHRGKAGFISYATAKGGVLQMTRSMAMDLAPYRIRVNSVTPTQTGTSRGSLPGADGIGRTAKPKNIPLGRWGEPDDQAQAVLFLASPNSSFVTGENINVDGGLLALFPSERPHDFG